MHTVSEASQEVGASRHRRRVHSAEFKAQVVAACSAPGVSVAAMAMAKGVNANLARRWVVEAERRGTGALVKAASGTVASTFVPLQLPSMQAPPLDIRIELRCGTTTISVSWPCAAARKHQQVAFLHPRPPQRSLPICHQPFTIPLPPIGRGHFQMEDQPAPSIVPDQDGGQQFGIVQGNVARAGVAGQEMRYGRLRVGPA